MCGLLNQIYGPYYSTFVCFLIYWKYCILSLQSCESQMILSISQYPSSCFYVCFKVPIFHICFHPTHQWPISTHSHQIRTWPQVVSALASLIAAMTTHILSADHDVFKGRQTWEEPWRAFAQIFRGKRLTWINQCRLGIVFFLYIGAPFTTRGNSRRTCQRWPAAR